MHNTENATHRPVQWPELLLQKITDPRLHLGKTFSALALRLFKKKTGLTMREWRKKNAAEFTATNWIGFLESAAIIDRPDGTRRYAYIQLAR